MCVINDPLGQAHSPISRDHYSKLKFVFFWEGRTRTDLETPRAWENSDHCQPWLGVGQVDQYRGRKKGKNKIKIVVKIFQPGRLKKSPF